MSSGTPERVSDEFLKIFDILLLTESAEEARDLVHNSDLIENLEFHAAGEDVDNTPDDNESKDEGAQ